MNEKWKKNHIIILFLLITIWILNKYMIRTITTNMYYVIQIYLEFHLIINRKLFNVVPENKIFNCKKNIEQ